MRLTLAILALTVCAGCKTASPLYTAEAVTPETAVDGEAADWPRALRPVPNEAGLSLGLRRDADDLVVIVIASDQRQARRIALGGLRIWVDPLGGRDRILGVRFPAPPRLGDRIIEVEGRTTRRSRGPVDEAIQRRFADALDTVEITRGEGDPVRQSVGSVEGLETAATWTDWGMVVEMRLSLDARPDLLAADADGALGLGFELVEIKQAPPRQARARGGQPQGRAGARGPEREVMRGEPESRPAPTVDTVTRWLRIE